jgi:hypothetical protein
VFVKLEKQQTPETRYGLAARLLCGAELRLPELVRLRVQMWTWAVGG